MTEQEDKLLTVGQVCELIGVSRTTWLTGVKKGIYPQPIYISMRVVRWKKSEVLSLLNRGPDKKVIQELIGDNDEIGEIEHNIPIPRKSKYPFKEMDVGDSFLVKGIVNKIHQHPATSSARYYAKQTEADFVFRRVNGGFRIWRVK